MQTATPDSPPPATLWDALDVAQYLKVSRSWIYSQAERGKLPHFKVGGLLRFDPEEIKAFARGCRPTQGKVLSFPAGVK